MGDSQISLAPVFHRHLTKDLPGWLVKFDLHASLVLSAGFLAYGLPKPWPWVGFLCVGLVMLAVAFRFGMALVPPVGTRVEEEDVMNLNDASVRLICWGRPPELRRIQEVSKEFFEPSVFAFSSIRRSWVQYALWVTFMVTAWVATRMSPLDHLMATLLMFGAITAVCLTRAFWPAYYRVSPGRLETLRFGFLGGRLKSHLCTDLRSARIACRYQDLELDIHRDAAPNARRDARNGAPESQDGDIRIQLSELGQAHAFVESVFRAAMCERPSPRLPTNELVG